MANRNDRESGLSPEMVLEELAAIGFARATDYLEVADDTLRIKATDALTPGQSAAIASVERSSSGLKVKFYDKLRALELLGKCVGLFDGKAAPRQEENNLLQAILAATEKEVDCSDIPELQQAPELGNDLVEPSGPKGV